MWCGHIVEKKRLIQVDPENIISEHGQKNVHHNNYYVRQCENSKRAIKSVEIHYSYGSRV